MYEGGPLPPHNRPSQGPTMNLIENIAHKASVFIEARRAKDHVDSAIVEQVAQAILNISVTTSGRWIYTEEARDWALHPIASAAKVAHLLNRRYFSAQLQQDAMFDIALIQTHWKGLITTASA
jgi:hypothetical protein